MNKLREAANDALNALLRVQPQVRGAIPQQDVEDAIDRLRAALAEPEVEPVLRWSEDDGTVTSLYASPPRREWVSLTDEEIDAWPIVGHESLREFVRAIEAALKEKNHEPR